MRNFERSVAVTSRRRRKQRHIYARHTLDDSVVGGDFRLVLLRAQLGVVFMKISVIANLVTVCNHLVKIFLILCRPASADKESDFRIVLFYNFEHIFKIFRTPIHVYHKRNLSPRRIAFIIRSVVALSKYKRRILSAETD